MRDVELKIEKVRTDELLPYYGNAKKHPRKQVEQIAKSIKEFGNCDPLAIWTNEKGDYEIVEGHGRLMALDMLGIKEAPVIFLDHLSDEQRRQYTHVHNQLTMNSGWDEDILSDDMLAMPDFDWEEFGFCSLDEECEDVSKCGEEGYAVPLDDCRQYVLIKIENELDWINAQDVFDLKKKKRLQTNSNGSGGGDERICRVVTWEEFYERFLSD